MTRIDPYQDSDAADVSALFGRIPTLPSTSEASFRAFTEMGFNRGARDFRVVRDEVRVVGVLTSTLLLDVDPPLRHFRIAIDPEYRRRGLGRRLLDEVEAQGGAPRLQCNSQRSWGQANEALEHVGFRVAHTERLMRLSGPPTTIDLPQGVSLRPATPADDEHWMALHRTGYEHREDFFPLEPSDLESERGQDGFVLLLAEHEGAPVGLCHGVHHEPGEALINSVVVHPRVRGRGVGGALMVAVIAQLQRDRPVVTLNVQATNTSAIGLYERLGFVTYDEILTYQRDAR